MGSHCHQRTLLLISLVGLGLASRQLQIPSEVGETDERLEKGIAYVVDSIVEVNKFHRLYYFITYSRDIGLRPSLEQRLMDKFSVPIYTIGSGQGPLNRSYPTATNLVIILFSGLDDPTLTALKDTELSSGSHIFTFLFVPPLERVITMDEVREFFSWCWERRFDRSLLFFRGHTELETWSYYYFTNITISRIYASGAIMKDMRSHGYRFYVQVANDLPSIFWYNSSEQADVIGGNMSVSGPVGILMVEFVRYINATMDILPIPSQQSLNYGIPEEGSDRRVDMVANLVVNDSYHLSPVVTDTKICLMVPRRRPVPFHRFFDKSVSPGYYMLILIMLVCVFGVKYVAHPHRFIGDTLFSTIRFGLGLPLPGGQLDRLPLADKIVEVYSLIFVGVLIGAGGSMLATFLTTGLYYPPITDVESMQASGLRILTDDRILHQAFRDGQLPSALVDLVDLVDELTITRSFAEMNDNYAYVVRTHNWKGIKLYQQRLKNKRFELAGPKLCSDTRYLRLPISPHSPLRYFFPSYFLSVLESGLQQKWLKMGFQKFLASRDIRKLPVDEANDWKPLPLAFYSIFIKIYIAGMLLSSVVFVLELLYKRYDSR